MGRHLWATGVPSSPRLCSRQKPASGSSGSGGKREITVITLYVRRAAAGSFSSQVTGDEDSSPAPMLFHLEAAPAKIARHALFWRQRRGQAAADGRLGDAERAEQQQQEIAACVLAGSQMSALLKLLLRGLSDARRQLRDEGSQKIMLSVERNLEVVPGLTQQLKTMTCQHKQLLGLLAAQDKQAAAAAAAAAAAEPQQQ
ncbi:hypothetical protein OEZ85_002242 [Tetradesmus obliquus]|uniref:BLOC-1-related complex subunit 7 n=1 Tax=Tetradesmus obliquus TaxID=3088 RepID=A0ABY8U2J7_TETOB|nr:hypothetical protein OEZ85_002242 [Tetradesmus obliquus]